MRKIDELLNMANERGVRPARSQLRLDGTECHTWHAGGDRLRFARVEDLPGGESLLVTVVDDKPVAGHDGFVEAAFACRRFSADAALRAVEYALECMRRGTRVDASVM